LFTIRTAALTAAFAAAFASFAVGQEQSQFVPPEDAHFQINLYPITKFRGNPQVITESDPDIRAIEAESVIVTRGIWELCSERNYFGRCVRVSATREGYPVAIVTRSVRLIGDTGPTFVEIPTARAGPDLPIDSSPRVAQTRAAPTPVIAPPVEQGGVAGDDASLAGREVAFYPTPTESGLRVLACAQGAGASANLRCVQAAADGFCAAQGYRDSGWRETEVVAGRAYLVNVLCKQADDSEGARNPGGIRIPFF
jgi:hypothetical protein